MQLPPPPQPEAPWLRMGSLQRGAGQVHQPTSLRLPCHNPMPQSGHKRQGVGAVAYQVRPVDRPCNPVLVFDTSSLFVLLDPSHCAAAAAGLPQEAIPACRQMKQQLLSKVSELQLPANFLDVLMDELGGPKAVAEMTGRKGRVVRHVSSGGRQQVMYELRAKPDSSEMDSLNGKWWCFPTSCGRERWCTTHGG